MGPPEFFGEMNKKKQLLFFSGFFIALGLFAVFQASEWKAPPEADKLENPLTGKKFVFKDGKRIYHEECWRCHGDKGKGNGQAAVGLTPKPADFTSEKVQAQSDGALFWKISVGKGSMTGYKDLYSPVQRWELVNYIRELGKSERVAGKR